MKISMIAAMAKNRVIGADNQMPWHLPADLGHFKRTTLGKPIVMGRKTYESIGKALPGRLNIVVSRDKLLKLSDATVVQTCEQAIQSAGKVDELMVIGGGTMYNYFLPLCQRLYLTEIDFEVAGDTYFPDYSAVANWRLIDSTAFSPDQKNQYSYTFKTLDRI